MNEVVPNKIRKIDSDKLDDMGVWKAIISSPQTIIEKFDDLKHTPRVWTGQLECSIVAVGGSIETHALGVLPFGFQNESSKWLLKFDFQNENATWQTTKDAFITEFEGSYTKKLSKLYEKRKSTELISTYAKKQIELAEKLFPSLTQPELNLFVMAGLEEKNIKMLKKQKNSPKETFLILCTAIDEMDPPVVVA